MLGHHAVHLVDEDDVGLAGREARFDELLEQAARVDGAADALVLGAAEVEFTAVADGFHELVGDEDAVVEIERLAVEVARGFADLEKLLDLGMRSEEHTSELQSLMRISYAVFCLKKKNKTEN